MRWTALVLVTALAASCGGESSRPCGVEMGRLHRRETQRIHGLSQNDNLSEAVFNLQSAARCARDADAEEVLIHAHLLQSRLVARGDVNGLAAAARVLGEAGVTLATVPTVKDALDESTHRLTAYARALKAEPAELPDAPLRATLAAQMYDEDNASPLPDTTRAVINHVDRSESCLTLVNHQGLPTGTAVATLVRGNTPVTLTGEPTSFGVSQGKTRLVHWCITGPLMPGDVLQVSMGGERAWSQVLSPTPDDEVRGALRWGFEGRDVKAMCAKATEHRSRIACALAGVP